MKTQKCIRCLYTSNHPFRLTFRNDGLCSGCIVHSEKESLDWNRRLQRLIDSLQLNKPKRLKRAYDCIVPVRGTPEYFKVLDIVINVLKLHPLIVVYNSHFNTSVGIANIDRMRECFDVDLIHYTTNPTIYKKLIKESLNRIKSIRWPYLAGETQFPVKIAQIKQIPLIIWPYHQATEQVGSHSYIDEVEMTRRSRHEYDLLGIEPHQLYTHHNLLNAKDLVDIEYPNDKILASSRIRGIYLSNFFPWDSRTYSEQMIAKYGAFCAENYRTFDSYDRIDDCTYMTVHDLFKNAKLGYSRVTDSLTREIRFNRISREDALNIEAHYQNTPIPDSSIEEFCFWLGADPRSVNWILKHYYDYNISTKTVPLNVEQKTFIKGFQANYAPLWDNKKYIIYGKGVS